MTPNLITPAASVPPETIDLMVAKMMILARMGVGDDDIVLIRSAMSGEPRLIPLHAHGDTECFYVLSGELDIYVGDDTPGWRSIKAGRGLTIAGNVKHAVRNASGAPVDSILATTGRITRFFLELSRPDGSPHHAAPVETQLARVHDLAKSFGYWMASPEENALLSR